MFPLRLFILAPGVQVTRKVERPLGSKANFQTDICGGRGIIEQVGLDCDILSFELTRKQQKKNLLDI